METVLLKNVTITGKGEYGIAASSCQYNPAFPQYIRITDISDDGRYMPSPCVSISPSEYPTFNRYFLHEGDIVFARTGASTGRNYYYNPKDGNLVFAGFLIRFSIDPVKINPQYIKYYCQTQKYCDWVVRTSTGSTRENLNAQDYANLEIPLKTPEEQQHIVDILGSIDNSIEKSEQIISEIERLIHLQFSVFYGGLTTKSTIGKEFECCLGGTPKTTCPEYWDGNINWINSGEVNKLRICNASKKISQLGMEKSATKLLNRGTTVIAITGATLGQVSLLEIDTCANQSVIGIGENQIKKDFIYPLIMHHISDLIKKQTGGAQQHINMNDVKSLEIMVPTLTQYRDYSFEVMPLFDLQSSLCVKIEKMKELKALYLKKFFG